MMDMYLNTIFQALLMLSELKREDCVEMLGVAFRVVKIKVDFYEILSFF